MHLHEAIGAVERETRIATARRASILQTMRGATAFCLPSIPDMAEFFDGKKKIIGKKRLFMDFAEYTSKLPYPIMWIEFPHSTGEHIHNGVLLIEKEKAHELFNIQHPVPPGVPMFLYFFFICVGKQWVIDPLHGMVTPGVLMEGSNGNILRYSLYKTPGLFVNEALSAGLSAAELCLLLLSCKNIAVSRHYPSIKLNKSRMKKNKTPFMTYHTLTLRLPSRQGAGISGGVNEEKINRQHLCRGHFKLYTKDNPLFGKYTGMFWWSPHIRGAGEYGRIEKDYKIELK